MNGSVRTLRVYRNLCHFFQNLYVVYLYSETKRYIYKTNLNFINIWSVNYRWVAKTDTLAVKGLICRCKSGSQQKGLGESAKKGRQTIEGQFLPFGGFILACISTTPNPRPLGPPLSFSRSSWLAEKSTKRVFHLWMSPTTRTIFVRAGSGVPLQNRWKRPQRYSL